MRIILTGGSGFLGRALAQHLSNGAHEVVSLSRSPGFVAGRPTLLWDMCRDPMPPVLEGVVDAVVHLAQSRNFRRFPEDAAEMFRVNVVATASLLDWAINTGVRQFVFISSGAVYQPFAGRLEEDAPLAPPGYLGASKFAAEVLARPYADKMNLCVLRVFFPYGPGQSNRLMPDLIRRVIAGEAVTLAGEDGLVFTPTYVDDVVGVIATALIEAWTGTFNLASPHALSIRDAAERIGRLLRITPRYVRLDQPAPSIVPSLHRLASRYAISSFRSVDQGLQNVLETGECSRWQNE
jgi:UDP-glucose 4-epimerase